MTYAGTNNYSKKVGAPPAWGQGGYKGTSQSYPSTIGSGVGCKGEPSGTGGLSQGSVRKLGNAKKQ
jgi:hypothetical protein